MKEFVHLGIEALTDKARVEACNKKTAVYKKKSLSSYVLYIEGEASVVLAIKYPQLLLKIVLISSGYVDTAKELGQMSYLEQNALLAMASEEIEGVRSLMSIKNQDIYDIVFTKIQEEIKAEADINSCIAVILGDFSNDPKGYAEYRYVSKLFGYNNPDIPPGIPHDQVHQFREKVRNHEDQLTKLSFIEEALLTHMVKTGKETPEICSVLTNKELFTRYLKFGMLAKNKFTNDSF